MAMKIRNSESRTDKGLVIHCDIQTKSIFIHNTVILIDVKLR